MGSGRLDAHDSKLYSDLSLLYDLIFRRIFYPRIARVMASLRIPPGARVLELGVGTGLSLAAYPRHCQVIGIDLARDMLDRAREKVLRNSLTHVNLMQMDALHLGFAESCFDYVTAFHVVSVVPDPAAMIRAAQRACRPGGTIVIINHFRGDSDVPRRFMQLIDPVTRWLGWRSTLSLTDVLDGAPLRIERAFKWPRRSLFTVVIAKNTDYEIRPLSPVEPRSDSSMSAHGSPLTAGR